ncbi:MAG: DUF6588 family protein [Balneolaceae bacterium]|nr:DUF6588 family protein [Balneolaceae bacterium]
MKKGYKIIHSGMIAVMLLAFTSLPVLAQFGNAGEILRAGKADANIIMKEYLKPIGEGFGTDLNSGWFSTAKTHATLGFDITVNASLAIIPNSGQAFDITGLNLQEVELVSGGPKTPTVAGDDNTDVVLGSQTNNPVTGQRLFEFDMPEGSGFPYVPAPMIQASVGVIKKTDVTLRYLPKINLPNDAEVNLFGLGVKHEITQWLPGGNKLPIDLSVQAGFTNLSSSIDFEVLPEVDNDTKNEFSASTWEGQKAKISSDAFTLNAIVGKTLPVISVFGGVGYQTSTVKISTPGSYPLVVPNDDYNPAAGPSDPNSNTKKIAKVDEPLNLKYDENGGMHVLAGFRLKLLFFNISGSYTLSENPVAQVGVGIGIR